MSRLSPRTRFPTQDYRLSTRHSRTRGSRPKNQGSRLKAQHSETGHLRTAPHHPPEPHRRRASAASAVVLLFLLLLLLLLLWLLLAAPPRCWGWVHSGLRSAVAPPTPCTAKVLGCVVQHRQYRTATMTPCPMESGGTWSRCALHSDISINFKAALPTHHCMSGIAKACSALLCCDIYSTCTPRYTHARGALPPKRAQ